MYTVSDSPDEDEVKALVDQMVLLRLTMARGPESVAWADELALRHFMRDHHWPKYNGLNWGMAVMADAMRRDIRNERLKRAFKTRFFQSVQWTL